MATYPNDATAPITAFGFISEVTFANTTTKTSFNLSTAVDFRGEIIAISDGVVQATDSYTLSNSGGTVTFDTAPNASNLTLKTVSIPSQFRVTRQEFSTTVVEYSNTTSQVVDGNTYLINGNTISFALPPTANVTQPSEIMVFLSGLSQTQDSFVFPSVALGNRGIDIADNAATKLLLNFNGNLDDDSDFSHTATKRGAGSASFDASERLIFDGSDDYVFLEGMSDFDLNGRSFTLDTFVKPDTGTSMTANQTLYSRYEDANNYHILRFVGSNSNVGFIVNNANTITEIYGGNANGGSNYHVAVSYDATASNMRLYVSNAKVAHTNYQAQPDTTGNIAIGANTSITGNGEFFKGQIDFVRLAHAARYRTETHVPLSTYTLGPDTGAPLGSIDPNDQLSIRIFDSAIEVQDRFTSMIDRKPDRGIGSQRVFDTIVFNSQAGYEKRRLKSRRSKRSYDLQYTNVTGIEKTAIENFYVARSGEFEAFTFDLDHINESGTITTRFSGPLQIEQVLSTGSNLTQNFYTISFNLQETYD